MEWVGRVYTKEIQSVTSLEAVQDRSRRTVKDNNRYLNWDRVLENLDCPVY